MTKWIGHDGSDDCPKELRGIRHMVEVITYDGSGNAAVLIHHSAGYRRYWGNVAAWRVIERSLDERLLKYLEDTLAHPHCLDLVGELRERIAKDG